MNKIILTIALLASLCTAQVLALNQAGITNVVVEDTAITAAGRQFFRSVSIVDSNGAYGTELYGKMDFANGKMYYWASLGARTTGDTSASILAVTGLFAGGYGVPKQYNFRTKNNSHISGSLQIIPNNGLVESGNKNITLVTLNVSSGTVNAQIATALSALGLDSTGTGLMVREDGANMSDLEVTAPFVVPSGDGPTGLSVTATTIGSDYLAGTGTRVMTTTSAGVLGNATTIAGANTWSDKQTFSDTAVGGAFRSANYKVGGSGQIKDTAAYVKIYGRNKVTIQPPNGTVIGNPNGVIDPASDAASPHKLSLVKDSASIDNNQLLSITSYGSGTTGTGTFQNNVHWSTFGGKVGHATKTADSSTYMSMGFRGCGASLCDSSNVSQSIAAFQLKGIGAWNGTNAQPTIFQFDVSSPGAAGRATSLTIRGDSVDLDRALVGVYGTLEFPVQQSYSARNLSMNAVSGSLFINGGTSGLIFRGDAAARNLMIMKGGSGDNTRFYFDGSPTFSTSSTGDTAFVPLVANNGFKSTSGKFTAISGSGNRPVYVRADGTLVDSSASSTATFTLNAGGMSGTVTGTGRATLNGKAVTIYVPDLSGTSDSAGFTISGLPAAYWPAQAQLYSVGWVTDNGLKYVGMVSIDPANGNMYVYRAPVGLVSGDISPTSTFTASGDKEIKNFSTTYIIN